ncbi:hypothetical protein TrVGV298_008160 [Trichoderma virens]|nr:hypothetical protein TrVGV298_008160 [Trichoderma virens]
MSSFTRMPMPGGGVTSVDTSKKKRSTHDPQSQVGQRNSSGNLANDFPASGPDNDPTRMTANGASRRSNSEKFNVKVDTQTGCATCTIPIPTSSGRSSHVDPVLSLEYSSGTAGSSGVFGMGWRLAGVDSISRKTSRGVPTYDDHADVDVFVHSALGDLVPSDKPTTTIDGHNVREYRARVEGPPTRVEQWTTTDDADTFWRVTSSNNIVAIYGLFDSDRIFCQTGSGPSAKKKVFSWLASEQYDSGGNHVVYTYKPEDNVCESGVFDDVHSSFSQRYLKSIQYGNATPSRSVDDWNVVTRPSDWLFEVVFDFGEHNDERPTTKAESAWNRRHDPFSTYNSGFEIRTYRRCSRVLMFHHFPSELGRQDCLVSSTCFDYETDERSGVSFLTSSVQKGHSPKGDSDYWTLAMPPVQLGYTKGPPDVADLPVEEMDLRMSGLDTSMAQWVDLDGEGAPGILTKSKGGGCYYQRNVTGADGHPEFGEPRPVSMLPSMTQSAVEDWRFEDVRGKGALDVVVMTENGGLRGFYERDEDDGWLNYVPFQSQPNLDNPEDYRSVDLSGTGTADLLSMAPMAGGSLVWQSSLGSDGFCPAQAAIGAPVLSLGDPTSLIQLCDMTGDGLADIVEIRNGNVSYWPNTGHGTFGCRIIMGNAPSMAAGDLFSPQRVRLADITGSGTTDLLYVRPEGGVVAYYNRSGNDWSDGDVIPGFHLLDRASAVDILDLGGQGLTSLCWVSDLYHGGGDDNDARSTSGLSTVYFVNLSGPQHPGLLEKWSNGTGLETTCTYKSSFSFYSEDAAQGTPWATKLPFPLLCVSQTVMVDKVTQTSSTARYAYHNGYYDYAEKMFRGFQMVETWDAEEFDSVTASPFQRPPVLTRDWFYIGVGWVDESSRLPWSYEINAPRHDAIASTTLPLLGADVAVSAEAYRALAGQPRRKEVFSADQSDPKAAFPYLISQQTYDVVLRQTAPAPLVCRVDGREEVTAHYERATVMDEQDQPELSIQDARVQHRLTLQTDDYGNVLLEALVDYGKPSSQLPNADDQRKQEETVVSYTEMRYTNAVESKTYFQSPRPAEVQKYRVFPATAISGKDRYAWEMIAKDDACFLKEAVEIPLKADADEQLKHANAKGYRILLADQRTIYTSTDLLEALPIGVAAEFSVVDREYQLVFTSDYLQEVFGDAKPAADVEVLAAHCKGGGYVELNGEEGKWWTQPSRSIFGDDDPGHRLMTARTSFFIPSGEVDAYGNTSTVELDHYHLLVKKTTDAVGSIIFTVSDYAKLASIMTIDANGNRVQRVSDPLGRAVGIAVLGKEGNSTGNNLDGFKVEIDQQTLDAFFTTPYGDTAKSLLAGASQRTIYDIDSYRRSGVPSRVAELTRHDHVGKGTDVSPISVRITYLGGSGVGIQSTLLSSDTGKTEWDFDGWVINDNKGQPVQKFQLSRASSHAFRPLPSPSDGTVPVTTTLRDPLGRVLGVLYSDHTWSKTRFTPWTKAEYDAGNTSNVEDPVTDDDVGPYFKRLTRSLYYPTWRQKRMADGSSAKDKIAARQGDVYADAPTITHLDALGRAIFTETGTGVETRQARVDYNSRGQICRLRDALDRTVEKVTYDLLGRQLHTANMDRGRRWLLSDSDGLSRLSWSEKQTRKRSEYDALRRLKSVWRLSSEEHAVEMKVTEVTYGEGQPDDAASNLRGQVHQCRDQAGLLTNSKFDVLGRCTMSTRRYANEYRNRLDWSSVKDEEAALEKDEHKTEYQYNALNLPVENVGSDLGMARRQYDVAGRLAALELFKTDGTGAATSTTNNIKYNANGMITDIITIRTTDNAVLQDVSYTYDCRAKVVQTEDAAKIAVNDADSTQEYHYDCLGQLVQATGRIQVGSQSKHITPYSFNDDKPVGDSKTIRYTETYAYDKAGNMLTMSNTPNTAGYTGWTRAYTYAEQSCITVGETSNRLTRTEVGKVTEEYKYEGYAGRHGCMTYIPGYSHLSWNDDDRLDSFSTQNVGADNGNTPEMTWYVYDAEGTRVRKVTDRYRDNNDDQPRKSKDIRYLPMGDIFSSYTGDNLQPPRVTYTLIVADAALGSTPISLVEHSTSSPMALVRYRLGERLEVDPDAKVVSYNEFSPFGSGTYQASNTDAPRAYRFASYRRDLESGLYACGARYYAPWLGRWTSADPIGVADGLNLFAYVRNDPINFDDPGGTIKNRKYNRSLSESSSHEQAPGSSGTFSSIRDIPAAVARRLGSSLFDANHPPPVAPGFTRLWRATDLARGIQFVRFGDVSAVRTTAIGNFNRADETAAYWAATRASAEVHAKHLMRADKKALIHMDVPESVLASGTAGVHDYGPEASTQWEERVGYYSIPDKKLASAMKERNHQNQVISTMNEHNLSEWDDAEKNSARIIAERAAEVTIGAETPVIFNSKSTVFELGNGPEMQYAFKGVPESPPPPAQGEDAAFSKINKP